MKRLVLLGIFTLLAQTAGATVFQVMVGMSGENIFVPANLTVQQGDTVFFNAMSGFHNVRHSCEPSAFGNEPASAPWNLRVIFNLPAGVYPIVCDVHPETMTGSITVEPRGRWNVAVRNFSFTPRHITISQGDTVVWSNTQGTHNVHHTGSPSLFGNGIATSPWTYSFVFNLPPDSFPYVCEVHPALMNGSVKVLAPLPPSDPTGLVIAYEPGQVVLSWNGVCGASEYAVYYSLNPSTDPFTELAGNTAETTFTDPLDALVQRRYYVVRAVFP